MLSRTSRCVILARCVAMVLPGGMAAADELSFETAMPACGKVCQLVCETKTLTATCYACECDEICIPGPSRPGCKHCATCRGQDRGHCRAPGCSGCTAHTPACEFCWRDWFACGCAKPQTVRVLTKYEAEKQIAWYHWEVVDAACGDCAQQGGPLPANRRVYKPAPAHAELGDVLPLSKQEWAELAAVLAPGQDQPARQSADQLTATIEADPLEPDRGPERPSIAERLNAIFRK